MCWLYNDRLIRKHLTVLIECAKLLGLPESDVKFAVEFIEHDEYELCFDHVVVQLYEYALPIPINFHEFIVKLTARLGIPEDEHSYVGELVHDDVTPLIVAAVSTLIRGAS